MPISDDEFVERPELYLIGDQWRHPITGQMYEATQNEHTGALYWKEVACMTGIMRPTTNKNGNAGKWAIELSAGGYPVWCKLFYDGKEIAHGIRHEDLRDLQYTINRAILAARDALPASHKHEMD